MMRPGVDDPARIGGDLARPAKRRRVLALGLGVVALVLGVAWFLRPAPVAEVAEASEVEAAVAALVVPAPVAEGIVRSPAARPPGASASVPGTALEVCGQPPLTRPGGPEAPALRALARTVLSEQLQWTARMLAHPDRQVVAAGWLQVEWQGQLALGAVHRSERAACRADRACAAEADARFGSRLKDLAQMARDPLAALAVASGDPAIHAHAARACAREPRVDGACGQVSTAQWARIEPDNMDAWLQLADEAHARRDAAAVAEALHRAALAPRQETHLALRFDALQATAVPDTHPASRSLALGELVGATLAAGRPGWTAALAHCHKDHLADANRHQACHALAEAFVERGATWLDFGLGLSLAGRLGWPEARIAALRADEKTMLAFGEAELATDQPLSCAAIERLESHLAERSRLEELTAARARLARADADARRAALAAWAVQEDEARARAAALGASSPRGGSVR